MRDRVQIDHYCDWQARAVRAEAEVERLRADRDRWIRAYNRLDGAIKNHDAAYSRDARLFAEQADEALWKAREKCNRDMVRAALAASGEQA